MSASRKARAALQDALLRERDCPLDEKGYVVSLADNLVDGVDDQDFRDDLSGGAGKELEGKFRAPHSSSALAVNSFAPFRRKLNAFRMPNLPAAGSIAFEVKCPNGLARAQPPNLDVLVTSKDVIVGVESKLLEYFSPHRAAFSARYRTELPDHLRDGPWFAEMLRLSEDPQSYRHLDAAQLVKHALGLAHTFRENSTRLLYVFWEPGDADQIPECRRHRQELQDFADRVSGGTPQFSYLSYPELWDNWSTAETDWVQAHASALQRRYGVVLNERKAT